MGGTWCCDRVRCRLVTCTRDGVWWTRAALVLLPRVVLDTSTADGCGFETGAVGETRGGRGIGGGGGEGERGGGAP